jgi:hypothetical protein
LLTKRKPYQNEAPLVAPLWCTLSYFRLGRECLPTILENFFVNETKLN